MAITWQEIKQRSAEFAKKWENETSEKAEAKTFWDNFFHIFDLDRRRLATFEQNVKKLGGKQGFIDLFWKGVLIVEHKSVGKDLDKAFDQALDYFPNLKEYELPRYVLVSDFARFRLYDLDDNLQHEFLIQELTENISLFGFMAGHFTKIYKEEDPINLIAAELLGKLFDNLSDLGYETHLLENFLVRLVFCMFAEDTAVFDYKNQFLEYLENHTQTDGSDLGIHLAKIFQVLNQPLEKRMFLSEDLQKFPFINGKLFEEKFDLVDFNAQTRQLILECCYLDWSKISPAIFGSLFQAAMNPVKRRDLGAHYTSEKNILKAISPLFLDDLYDQFEKARKNPRKLKELHNKLGKITIFDPACGCGNFLIIAYRELRYLEIEIIKELYGGQQVLEVSTLIQVNVDQVFGIEIEEIAYRITQVAMWITDHQCNQLVSRNFGKYFIRIPLTVAPNLLNSNALQTDWKKFVSPKKISFILGNPPFIGKQFRNESQKKDMKLVFESVKINNSATNSLDYVAAWYIKAAQYIQNTKIRVAFISTNSIAQGEQVGILWSKLFQLGIKIFFAHQTFKWSNEASHNAQVHCVIIGFYKNGETLFDFENKPVPKKIFSYKTVKSEAIEKIVPNINPYLVDSKDILIQRRSEPLCDVPKIKFGNQPIDGGFLLFSTEEKNELIALNPVLKPFLKRFLGSHDFINRHERWCLWGLNQEISELRKIKAIKNRLEKVKEFRESSIRKETNELAKQPHEFAFVSYQEADYLLIPRVSSEKRAYIPMAFFTKEEIAGDSCLVIYGANLFIFGILTSLMHMAWLKSVGGRLKSDFRYSNSIVYNNFPFPKNVEKKKIEKVEQKAQNVLDIRKIYEQKGNSLADLYDPLFMPADLQKAHQELDKAVDSCYRPEKFDGENQRISFLFGLYEQYLSPLESAMKKANKIRKK